MSSRSTQRRRSQNGDPFEIQTSGGFALDDLPRTFASDGAPDRSNSRRARPAARLVTAIGMEISPRYAI